MVSDHSLDAKVAAVVAAYSDGLVAQSTSKVLVALGTFSVTIGDSANINLTRKKINSPCI